ILYDAHTLPMSSGPNVFTVVASRSHTSEETQQYIEELKKTHGRIETLSRGSSLKLCMVAEGKANVYPRFAPTMEWDTAAGHAIVRIAGADVLNHDTGNELTYNKEDLRNPWFLVER
ncbi:MAG: 3'(2'),5'-bisphosphate nucleotidase CysQ, partial [Bacteroidales bacterium]|nr:3'(2'),5'-bisphosphate nucleotidase CysQ [Bacteroidales bacterium]